MSKEMLSSDMESSDFPPTSTIYVCPRTSEGEGDNSPCLKVTGLGRKGYSFNLVVPSEFQLSI